MAELTLAEMNSGHYRMVETDPMYALEFAMDIHREAQGMMAPFITPSSQGALEGRVLALEHEIREPQPQWTGSQWDQVQQLRARVLHSESKLQEHIEKSQRKKGLY